jgi:hypothetical protein
MAKKEKYTLGDKLIEQLTRETTNATEPIQISANILRAMRIYVADKKLTLKELAETAIMNHIK